MTQPEDTTIDDLCAKAASRTIVYDRLYPEDVDTAYKEVSPAKINNFYRDCKHFLLPTIL